MLTRPITLKDRNESFSITRPDGDTVTGKAMPDRREGLKVDTKIPLPWLIGGSCTAIMGIVVMTWTFSAQNSKIENKIDRVLTQNINIEKRLDSRDNQLDILRGDIVKLQQETAINTLKITTLEAKK